MRRMLACLAVTVLAWTAEAQPVEPIEASWERLKALAGNWEGRYSDGTEATVSYRVVSDGTAVMETLESHDSSQMISMYHKDGASLLMTHYCSLGNQTRMRTPGLADGRLAFTFVDATNLKSPREHVMSGLVMTFPSPDRLVHEWSSRADGKVHTGRFEFVRRK
ncbi:MAG TPA: hypothetical protein VI589_07060 [Vicinamibacteria bacterium]